MRSRLAVIYAGVDLALIALCASFGAIYVLNSQIALICSSAIIFASFFGYKARVKKRVSSVDAQDFFDEDEEEDFGIPNSGIPKVGIPNEKAGIPNAQIPNKKEILKKESQKIPFRFYDFLGLFSPLRLLSYALLVIGFFYLVGQGLFEPFSFLAGLGVLPLSALLSGIFGVNE